MTKIITIIFLLLLFIHDDIIHAQEDARFLNDTKKNTYVAALSQALMKAFSKDKLAYTYLRLPCPVGQDTHIVSFSLALSGIKKPPVEKDLDYLNNFIQPFIKAQIQEYNAKGYDQIINESAFMLQPYAQDYTKKELPTIEYRLWQLKDPRKAKLFYMKVTFVERRENYLVVDFTIVARE